MRTIVAALAAACFAVPVMAQDAEFNSPDGRLTIRLLQGECQVPAVQLLLMAQPGVKAAPKAARITMQEQTFDGCWALDADNDVLLGDETGRRGFLPMANFRKVKST
jgi:hypothetical protein